MKISKSYTLTEFLTWTRRKIYLLAVMAFVPVGLYQLLGQKWIAAPWSVAVLLGTATSFIVGFRNAQTYQRMMEAQQIWAAIAGTSRYWGLISRDFPTTRTNSKALVQRHLAWLTALRYHLRGQRVWESASSPSNAEVKRKFYRVPERDTPLDTALEPYLSRWATAPRTRSRVAPTTCRFRRSAVSSKRSSARCSVTTTCQRGCP